MGAERSLRSDMRADHVYARIVASRIRSQLAYPGSFALDLAAQVIGQSIELVAILVIFTQVTTLGGFSAHGDQEDLLHWYSGLPGRPDVWLVHGEAEGAEGLRAALTARGVTAQVARPGLRIEPPAVAA